MSAEPKRIYVEVRGGCVIGVEYPDDLGVEVVVVDYDVEGYAGELETDVDGQPYNKTIW